MALLNVMIGCTHSPIVKSPASIPGRHAQFFRGFAWMARRDFFIGDGASPNPNAKGRGPLESN